MIPFRKYILISAWIVLIAIMLLISIPGILPALHVNSDKKASIIADSTAIEELGEALFSDSRFSSPEGRLSGIKKHRNSQFRISCKSCHLVDEMLNIKDINGGMRGYTDFSRRTPVPYRNGDPEEFQFTHRRTQQLINVTGTGFSAANSYHWDGEFNEGSEHASLLKLIEKTFVSRNMGWRDGEEKKSEAMRLKHILEEDPLAGSVSGNQQLFYTEQFCISFGLTRKEFYSLTGNEILSLTNEAIAFYIENIRSDIESPFDYFLAANGVSDPVDAGEEQLRKLLKKNDYIFIDTTVPVLNSEIAVSRKLRFGKKELEGLRLFMDRTRTNCSSCHTPPSFTDNRFHNIGVSEFDYKDVHGNFPGEFYTAENLLRTLCSSGINVLKTQFQSYPKTGSKESIDLGHALFTAVPEDYFGAFRTPTLRNLGYCNPYLHSGRAGTIKKAIEFHYLAGSFTDLHFISKKLPGVKLSPRELNLLVIFLNSLNDHYE